jgi:protein-S-isoprenylcysteine O-methyltransferase Ste14
MWRNVVGAALVGLWLILGGTSVARFWLAGTSILPMRPASTFIQSGAYRFTRNPMYVSLALLTVAFGLFFNTYWPIVLLIPVLLLIQQVVILREEGYLRRRFGADYEAYTRRVRRWL